jgi:hypothetical protein
LANGSRAQMRTIAADATENLTISAANVKKGLEYARGQSKRHARTAMQERLVQHRRRPPATTWTRILFSWIRGVKPIHCSRFCVSCACSRFDKGVLRIKMIRNSTKNSHSDSAWSEDLNGTDKKKKGKGTRKANRKTKSKKGD